MSKEMKELTIYPQQDWLRKIICEYVADQSYRCHSTYFSSDVDLQFRLSAGPGLYQKDGVEILIEELPRQDSIKETLLKVTLAADDKEKFRGFLHAASEYHYLYFSVEKGNLGIFRYDNGGWVISRPLGKTDFVKGVYGEDVDSKVERCVQRPLAHYVLAITGSLGQGRKHLAFKIAASQNKHICSLDHSTFSKVPDAVSRLERNSCLVIDDIDVIASDPQYDAMLSVFARRIGALNHVYIICESVAKLDHRIRSRLHNSINIGPCKNTAKVIEPFLSQFTHQDDCRSFSRAIAKDNVSVRLLENFIENEYLDGQGQENIKRFKELCSLRTNTGNSMYC